MNGWPSKTSQIHIFFTAISRTFPRGRVYLLGELTDAAVMANAIRESILSVYDTVADQSLWPSVLEMIARQINADGCIIFEWQGEQSDRQLVAPYLSANYDPLVLAKYIEKCGEYEAADQDIFESHSLKSDGINLIDDSVLAESTDKLMQRENVKVLQKLGIPYRAAALLNKDNTQRSRFSVQMNASRGPLNGEERAVASTLLPHVAKALDLGRPVSQLAALNQTLLAAIDHLKIGMCILDPRGNVVLKNQEFTRQLDEFQIFEVTRNGTLRLLSAANQKRFDALLSDALNHGKFGARPRKEAISTGPDGFLCVEIAPLDKSAEMGRAPFGGFVLYSTDTNQPVACDTHPIKHAFGLTAAELAIVESIGEGLTNVQIADRRERSVNTINTQVKSVLSKSKCSTRAQFVRLMMSFGGDYIRPGV